MPSTIITYEGQGITLGHFSCDSPKGKAQERFQNILGDGFTIINVEERI